MKLAQATYYPGNHTVKISIALSPEENHRQTMHTLTDLTGMEIELPREKTTLLTQVDDERITELRRSSEALMDIARRLTALV